MNAPDPYIPAGPVEQPPAGFRPSERRQAMAHVLRGVKLGAHDARIIEWIMQWDDSTIRTIASLIARARGAAALDETQLAIVLGALDEAADYRWACAQASCADCNRLDPARCADHVADEEMSHAYAATARLLREEAGQ